MNDVKLKPCPFCGQTAQVLSDYDSTAWKVGCNNTLCAFCPHVSMWNKDHAIAEWNTRATDSLVEQLAKALELGRANLQFLPPDYAVDEIDAALAAYREATK